MDVARDASEDPTGTMVLCPVHDRDCGIADMLVALESQPSLIASLPAFGIP